MKNSIIVFLLMAFFPALVSCQTAEINSGDIIDSEELQFSLEIYAEGFSIPWAMAFLPDGRMLVTEREGNIKIVEDGVVLNEQLSGVPEVYARGQGGLLDIKLHPDYENNGWIYLSYSKPGSGGAHTAMMRAKLDGHALTEHEELFVGQPKTGARQHFGSRIVFDDDGYVYLGLGDRGSREEAQDPSNHKGTVIRLHDNGSIPDDNPFVGHDSYQPEIYTYGNRNIQGMDIHPVTREVWSHEHGPRGGDEINIIRSGNNYGWPRVTHGRNYSGTQITPDTTLPGMEDPLHHWTPSIAPSGMAFVTGERYPQWEGNIMVGALAQQKVERVVLNDDYTAVVHQERLLRDLGRIRDVRMGPDGYLYVAEESNGRILRIVPVD